MAKQKGINTFSGTLGNLNFYDSMFGPIVRKRTSMNRKRVYNDPRMLATVQNATEFSRASHHGKILRDAVKQFLPFAKDNLMAPRMQSLLIKTLKTDRINEKGSRSIINGDLTQLRQFEFNSRAPLFSLFANNIETAVNRTTGAVTVSIPPFQPEINLKYPRGATHYQLTSLCCEIDFEKESFQVDNYITPSLLINDDLANPINITHKFSKASRSPVFVVFAIQFFEETNGKSALLLNYDCNPAIILEVDQVK